MLDERWRFRPPRQRPTSQLPAKYPREETRTARGRAQQKSFVHESTAAVSWLAYRHRGRSGNRAFFHGSVTVSRPARLARFWQRT